MSNLFDCFIRQLDSPVIFSAWNAVFFFSIFNILFVATHKKVIRITAFWVIAVMANFITFYINSLKHHHHP